MSVNKVNKTTGDLSLLAGGTLYADNPIGSIIPYGGATAPAGWFICDGTELVRATYPELFAVIGTSFGTPSDNTKFKLPDLREATTKGVGLTGKSNNHYDADGLALGEFIDDRLQDHEQELVNENHQELRVYPLQTSSGGTGVGVVSNAEEYHTVNATTILNGRHGNTTEVKAVGVNYIIKAVSVGVPADFMSAVNNLRTTVVAEPTALSNIGTSAGATQHDVNVAIDSMHQYDDASYVEIQSLNPTSQVTNISLTAERKGNVVTLRGNLVINLTGHSYYKIELLNAGSVPAKYRPSVDTSVISLGYRYNGTTYVIGRFYLRPDGSFALGEYYSSGNDLSETTFKFAMTYVV